MIMASAIVGKFLQTFKDFSTPAGGELHDRSGDGEDGSCPQPRLTGNVLSLFDPMEGGQMASPDSSTVAVAGQTAEEPPFREMVWIPPATYQMGSKDHYPEERPVHHEAVEGF